MDQNLKNKILESFPFIKFDRSYEYVLDECIYSKDNLLISAMAGTGKSLLIKILSRLIPNCIVLAPTGITALNLCNDGVAATTFHSFFLFPPVEVILDPGAFTRKQTNAIRAATTIIIDETSMVSNHLFDIALDKIEAIRGKLPRFILLGDMMQLSPVVPMQNKNVREYYQSKYNSNVMIFSSHWAKKLNLKTLHLRQQYRQTDVELQRRLVEIGYNEHAQDTLDYFNQRVMPLSTFEKQNPVFVRVASTNNIVNKINVDYTKSFPGTGIQYISKSSNWKGAKPNSDVVELKVGMQVMCLKNSYDFDCDYRNGTIGIIQQIDPKAVIIKKSDGKTTKVQRSTNHQYELECDNHGRLHYNPTGYFEQIDCKPMRASTVHKLQGATLDAAYIQPTAYTAPGLMYVALSRVREFDGIGLSRPLTMKDVLHNEEAWNYIQLGVDDYAEEPAPVDSEFELPV